MRHVLYDFDTQIVRLRYNLFAKLNLAFSSQRFFTIFPANNLIIPYAVAAPVQTPC
jgi:hypothetical protein